MKQVDRAHLLLNHFYPESAFGGFSDIDGSVVSYTRINALIASDDTILDVGCGRGAQILDEPIAFKKALRTLKGKVRKVIGIDVDPAGAQNPNLDEFARIQSHGNWPVASTSVDGVIADFVLEHIPEPDHFLSELSRVLKPGGFFAAQTTNVRGYVGFLSKLIPNRRHGSVVVRAQLERKRQDVFPICYQMNTVGGLRRHGFRSAVYGYDAEPNYLHFSPLAYRIGVWLHAITPAALKNSLFVFAVKDCSCLPDQ